jgi:SAM-dependent methyltransferase
MNKKKIIKNTLDYYDSKLANYGNNFRGMNWSSKKSQYLRFHELLKIGLIKNKSVHDVGCGNGELLNYLKKNKITFSNYLGSDISDKMIKISNNNFKYFQNIKFEKLNLLENKNHKKYDYVLASGIFNIKNNFSNARWQNYSFKMIDKMFYFSKIGIGFNMLTFDVDYKEKKLFYMSLDKLVSFIRKNLSKKIIINHSYNLWEFTIFIYK